MRIVSAERGAREWKGDKGQPEDYIPAEDPECRLCPGRTRTRGEVNDNYIGTYIFPNDAPAFWVDFPEAEQPEEPTHEPGSFEERISQLLFQEQDARGICEVNIYTPRHNESLNRMTLDGIKSVIRMWQAQYVRLGSLPIINYVAQFETRGSELGNSQPHPHGQTWASEEIPPGAAMDVRKQHEQTVALGRNALLAYAHEEIRRDVRLVYRNDNFAVVVPWWAKWPYETMAIPTSPVSSIDQLNGDQVTDYAKTLWVMTNTYGKLFNRPQYGAAYLFGMLQKPTDGGDYQDYQMRAEFRPVNLGPLRRKYLAAFEEFFGIQRDLTPEVAAQTLKKTVAELTLPWSE